MKRVFVLVLALLMVGAVALAEVDLSGMTFDELVALKEQINLAIWNCQEWQEVEIPVGVWRVGEDIPAGHWTISPAGDRYCSFEIGTELSETGKSIDLFKSSYWFGDGVKKNSDSSQDHIDYDFKEGDYFIVDDYSVIFTPYTGKPSLGFK